MLSILQKTLNINFVKVFLPRLFAGLFCWVVLIA